MDKKKCCMCGKEIEGFGNNPWGVLDKEKKLVEWKQGDVCCDNCNALYVIPGRLYLVYKGK